MTKIITVVMALLAVKAWADEPKPAGKKPQFERLLKGDDLKRADELTKRIDEQELADHFGEAVKAAEELRDLRQRVQGADHWETVRAKWTVEALQKLAGLSSEQSAAWRSTEKDFREAEALEAESKYRGAEPLYRKALDLKRLAFGEAHPNTAQGYNNLAVNLSKQGKSGEAEPLLRQAVAVWQVTVGEEHPETATGYTNLAYNLNLQGKNGEVEPLLRKALELRRMTLGDAHRDTATSYNNLAACLANQGKHLEADVLFRRALDLYRVELGETHPDTATGYIHLASILSSQGKYREAEPLLHKALKIKRAAFGDAHLDAATAYNHLAFNLNRQGKSAEAVPLYRKALEIKLAILGEGNPDSAMGYHNLGVALDNQGEYGKAEPLFRRSLDILTLVLRENHPDIARGYTGLAHNLNRQGKYGEAERLFRKALALRRLALGEVHLDTARAFNDLSISLYSQGKSEEAELLLRKALEVRRAVLGEAHPDTATVYNNLAYNLNDQGKYAEALSNFESAAVSYEQARIAVSDAFGRASYGLESSPYPPMASGYARAGRFSAAWAALESDFARSLLDEADGRHEIALSSNDQNRRASLVDRLRTARPEILILVSKRELTPSETTELDRLKLERAKIETDLAELAVAISRRRVASLDAVRAAIPADAALVAWTDVSDISGRMQTHWVCITGTVGDPIWERLPGTGPDHAWTNDDTTLPRRLRQALSAGTPDVADLARQLFAQRIAPLSKHLAGVKRLFVVPAGAMAGVPVEVLTRDYAVSYVPSGTFLARFKSAPKPAGADLLALGDPDFSRPDSPAVPKPPTDLPPGGLLIAQFIPGGNAATAGLKDGDVLLTYAGVVTDDLAKLKELTAAHAKDATVAVTVWREGQKNVATRDLKGGKLGAVFHPDPAPQAVISRRKADAALLALARGGDWTPLPGTRVELDRLAKLFGSKATVLVGSDASEQRLDQLRAAGDLKRFRYLHFATHGEADDKRAFESALILAQDHLPKDFAKAGEKWFDGKLTANEVLADWQLDAELVTLSACETALGRQGGGDGLLGFAQAFLAVGSRSVCLSLWKVDDAATALLMDHFYSNLITRKMGKAAALAEAKNWLRELSADEALRLSAELSGGVARGKGEKAIVLQTPAVAGDPKEARPFAHPKYWAAFVLIGDPD